MRVFVQKAGLSTTSEGVAYLQKVGSSVVSPIGNVRTQRLPVIPPYLTFSSDTSFALNVYDNTKHWDGTIHYSTDHTNWSEWSGTTTLSSLGNVLYLRGTSNTKITGSSASSFRWVLTGSDISVTGNIETLLDYATVETGNHPTMADYCYRYMFYGCTSLTTAPSLPATTLADYCYANMFVSCTSLTTAPSLPATILARGCYYSMFQNCTSLTITPELPAITLIDYCYYSMFLGCAWLTTVPKLPANTLFGSCYTCMFQDCTFFNVSATQTGLYLYEWRIPTSGTGSTAGTWNTYMLAGTGGTFKGDPVINTTYYIEHAPV